MNYELFCIFADCMNKGHKETISIRIVSCAFMVNLGQVEQISSNSRAMQLVMRQTHDAIPVSRSNVSKLKELLG